MAAENNVLYSFLKYLKIRFTKSYLKEITQGLSYNKSLHGVSLVLNEYYKVDTVCLRIQKTDLHKLDPPFVVQFNLLNQPLVVVVETSNTHVTFIYQEKRIREPVNNFNSKWEGLVLLAEVNEFSGEMDYSSNHFKESLKKARIPVILVSSVLLFIYHFGNQLRVLQYAPFTKWLLIGFYFIGLIISSLLLSQLVFKSGSVISKICNLTQKKGCTNILEGNASKLLGLVSWSEIGFLYFSSSLLTILLIKDSEGILFLLSILALPYTLWSIYYQGRLAKEWCMFCIAIQAILWAIFIMHLINGAALKNNFPLGLLIDTLLCFLESALGMWLLLPYIQSRQKLNIVNYEYQHLKFNKEIFYATLKSMPVVDQIASSDIIFGNRSVSFSITVVTDPFCPYCIAAHNTFKYLLNKYRDKLNIRFVFAIPGHSNLYGEKYNRNIDKKREVVEHLIGLYKISDHEAAEKIFDEWYETGKNDYAKFLKKYPFQAKQSDILVEMKKHTDWCKDADISATPTIYFNQNKLPGWYQISDLNKLTNTLIE